MREDGEKYSNIIHDKLEDTDNTLRLMIALKETMKRKKRTTRNFKLFIIFD